MTRAAIAGGAFATVLVLLALAAGNRALEQDVQPAGSGEGLVDRAAPVGVLPLRPALPGSLARARRAMARWRRFIARG